MVVMESDVRCYELIDKYFQYNDPMLVQTMISRLDMDIDWESIPAELRQRILKTDQEVQKNYSRWYNFDVFNKYMAIIHQRLKQNGIDVPLKSDDLVPPPKSEKQKLSLISASPNYTRKQLEFFRRRTEVYLNLWENASLEDLKTYPWENKRSVATARNTLQRVFWGNHLDQGQLIRLLSTDLSWFRHSEYVNIHSAYRRLIDELLKHYELYYVFKEQHHYAFSNYPYDALQIKNLMDKWDWVCHIWQDEEENEDQVCDSLEARWSLHCAYKGNKLDDNTISELIALDKAAMLSPNYMLFSHFERDFIHAFLLEQGVFDKLPE